MQVTSTLNAEDARHLDKQLRPRSQTSLFVWIALVGALYSVQSYLHFCRFLGVSPFNIPMFVARWQTFSRWPFFATVVQRELRVFAIAFVFFIAIMAGSYLFQQSRVVKILTAHALETTTRLESEKIELENVAAEMKWKWNAMKEIRSDEHGFYFFFTAHNAHMIPRRAFATQDEANAFLQLADRYHNAAKHPPQETPNDNGASTRI